MPKSIIRIVELVGIAGPQAGAFDPRGMYVLDYDPSAHDGRGSAVLHEDEARARRFDSPTEAAEFWRQQHGTRPDGKPNRPLTAYTVEILRVEK